MLKFCKLQKCEQEESFEYPRFFYSFTKKSIEPLNMYAIFRGRNTIGKNKKSKIPLQTVKTF